MAGGQKALQGEGAGSAGALSTIASPERSEAE